MPQATVDMSNRVMCDGCDTLFLPDSTVRGGLLFESKAICPTCKPKWMKSIRAHNEQHLIRDEAGAQETFYDAVMRWRGGNHAVVISMPTQEDADQMAASLVRRSSVVIDTSDATALHYADQARLPMWTIYKHPTDFPKQYVARMFLALPHVMATAYCIVDDTLDGLRQRMPAGTTCIQRQHGDEPQIVEVWL